MYLYYNALYQKYFSSALNLTIYEQAI